MHDLRRTVATGLQRLGIRLEVTEAVLNHISGTRAGIAGVYQRHDWATEKRAACMGGSPCGGRGAEAIPNVVWRRVDPAPQYRRVAVWLPAAWAPF